MLFTVETVQKHMLFLFNFALTCGYMIQISTGRQTADLPPTNPTSTRLSPFCRQRCFDTDSSYPFHQRRSYSRECLFYHSASPPGKSHVHQSNEKQILSSSIFLCSAESEINTPKSTPKGQIEAAYDKMEQEKINRRLNLNNNHPQGYVSHYFPRLNHNGQDNHKHQDNNSLLSHRYYLSY